MKRSILFITIVFLAVNSFAQVWCAPGATWTYTHTDGWTYDGMARYQYSGDTTIMGTSAQVITMHTEGYYWPWDTILVGDAGPYYTRVVGSRVDLWTGATFDTLYDFAASPGDHWLLNTPDGVDPFLLLTVADTGHLLIDAIALRYLVTTTNGWSSDTIIERLGSLLYQLVPWALGIVDAANGALRCYEDVDIDYHVPSWSVGCASFTGIAGSSERAISMFPNPGTDQFTLQLPPGEHTLEVFDATGQLVLRERLNTDRASVNTTALVPGLFTYRVSASDGALRNQGRWVKE